MDVRAAAQKAHGSYGWYRRVAWWIPATTADADAAASANAATPADGAVEPGAGAAGADAAASPMGGDGGAAIDRASAAAN